MKSKDKKHEKGEMEDMTDAREKKSGNSQFMVGPAPGKVAKGKLIKKGSPMEKKMKKKC